MKVKFIGEKYDRIGVVNVLIPFLVTIPFPEFIIHLENTIERATVEKEYRLKQYLYWLLLSFRECTEDEKNTSDHKRLLNDYKIYEKWCDENGY